MRSSSTPPTTPAPDKQRRAARATPQMAPGAPTTGRRTRRAQGAAAGAPDAAEAPAVPGTALAVLAPEELYRHEKARRVAKLDTDVMAEAKRMLEDMLAESSKRGGTVKGRPRAPRPAKSTDPVDAMNLERFDGLDATEPSDAGDE